MTLLVTSVLLLLVKLLIIVLKRCLKKQTFNSIFHVIASENLENRFYFNWILIKNKLLCSKCSTFTHLPEILSIS